MVGECGLQGRVSSGYEYNRYYRLKSGTTHCRKCPYVRHDTSGIIQRCLSVQIYQPKRPLGASSCLARSSSLNPCWHVHTQDSDGERRQHSSSIALARYSDRKIAVYLYKHFHQHLRLDVIENFVDAIGGFVALVAPASVHLGVCKFGYTRVHTPSAPLSVCPLVHADMQELPEHRRHCPRGLARLC